MRSRYAENLASPVTLNHSCDRHNKKAGVPPAFVHSV
jgi:hypothetical protein